MKEVYEIWKNKRFYAGFTEGDKSRYWKPFDLEIALREFNSCIDFWREEKGIKAQWELRIITDNRDKR